MHWQLRKLKLIYVYILLSQNLFLSFFTSVYDHIHVHCQVWPRGKTAFPDFLNNVTKQWWVDTIVQWHKTIEFDGLWIVSWKIPLFFMSIDLLTARPSALVFMIYASLAWILITIWKPYHSNIILLTKYRICIGIIDKWINGWPDKAGPSRRHFGRAVDRSILPWCSGTDFEIRKFSVWY